ncbi:MULTISPECIES: glycosyltransferase [Cupriavidus]|nr:MULTISPECIES: glycosyltransferase [Cupriavidus]MBB3012269.1 GT2 family glycosyltransferase [Cupriavidus alkaliphilus]RAS10186.1 GT2 family glycosyltransferase [Cupriavidus alkaliphilus]SCB08850.1 Glycosyltransferase, GT2 family [Cupriavidus alkaliphilus]SPR97944.1 putative glycosyltransferase [Cupriavidus taiwanensis]
MHSDLSVLIPFKDKAEMTLQCVDSLYRFGPACREILLISNNSSAAELNAVEKGLAKYDNARVLIYDQPFNYQKLNNWAVAQSQGSDLLFLNNDTELVERSRGLLESMVERAHAPAVGAVGCVLLYGDAKTIQHGGVFLVSGGLADHLFVGRRLADVLDDCKAGRVEPDIRGDVRLSAVTGAVTVVQRSKFEEIGGFDEGFIICGGDVDMCIRLEKLGYQTVLAGADSGFILHKESQSRAHKPIPFNDFYRSYLSYLESYDPQRGDRFVPTKNKAAHS